MLRASYRLLGPGGVSAFLTIFMSPGLSEAARRRALDSGPPGVGLDASHHDLLRSAGFADTEEIDVTEEYHQTAMAWTEHRDRFADELIEFEGRETFEERRAERQEGAAAVEDGLIRRSMFVAHREG